MPFTDMESQTYEGWMNDIIAEVANRHYTRREYYEIFVEGADPRVIYEENRNMAAELEKSGAITRD